MDQVQFKKPLLFFTLTFLALAAVLIYVENFKASERVRLAEEHLKNLQQNLSQTPVLAKAVSVYNLTKGEKIYGQNDQTPLPIASLAKIMTVVAALNQYKLGDVITISAEAVKQEGDFGLLAGERWEVFDIAKFTLVSSANDGVFALWENNPSLTLNEINEKAKRIGMKAAQFLNFTGLDIPEEGTNPVVLKAGALATAEDVNTMAMYGFMAYPEIFRDSTTVPEITLTSLSGFSHTFKNTNVATNKIPNLLFSKTGYTDLAGGNLTIIFENKLGEEIAVTVLGSTFEDRFTDMEKIVNILYNF